MYKKIIFRCLVVACAFSLSAVTLSCSDDDPKKQNDEVPPAVSLENIVDQQQVSGSLSIKINATDNDRVAKVEVYVDNTLVETLTEPPFEFEFDSEAVTDGKHTLKVVVTDKTGNTKTQVVEVTVNNTTTQPGETLLTIHVPAGFVGTGERPHKAFVVLHDADWKVIASANVTNGATLTLNSDTYHEDKFTVTELLVYASEGSEYLKATSYMDVPKGDWVLTDNDAEQPAPKSVAVSFNMFTEGFGYGVSSNAGLISGNSNVYVESTIPFSTHLDLSVSPGKLFVRQYFSTGNNKFFMYENENIKDGGSYEIDFSVLDQAEKSHELIYQLFDFPAQNGVVHLYGLPNASSTEEAYYLGQFQQGGNQIVLVYPPDAVTPFNGYFSSTQFTTEQGHLAYNRGVGKYNTTPLAVSATSESTATAEFISTSGPFDFFLTHFTLGEHAEGDWHIIGPPVVNRKLSIFELPETISQELDFVSLGAHDFDALLYISDFAGIEDYADLVERMTSSDQGFPEAIDMLEEKNLMIEVGASTGFAGRKKPAASKPVRDVYLNK